MTPHLPLTAAWLARMARRHSLDGAGPVAHDTAPSAVDPSTPAGDRHTHAPALVQDGQGARLGPSTRESDAAAADTATASAPTQTKPTKEH